MEPFRRQQSPIASGQQSHVCGSAANSVERARRKVLMTLRSVNIDHIATIREARRTNEPDPVAAAAICELAGAHGITVHLRGDRRHIQHRDVKILRDTIKTKLNIEMAAT